MKLTLVFASLLLSAAVFAGEPRPSSAVIGIAVAPGAFQLDRAAVNGNASLVSGSELSTLQTPGRIRLHTGAEARLGAASAAVVYVNHVNLLRGIAQVNGPSYSVLADGYTIQPELRGAQAVVRRQASGLQVAALDGPVRIYAPDGTLLARVQNGNTVDLGPAGPAGTLSMAPPVVKSGLSTATKATIAVLGAGAAIGVTTLAVMSR